MRVFLFFIFLLFALLILGAKSFVKAKEDELLVVFRLGELLNDYGPGLSIVIPYFFKVSYLRSTGRLSSGARLKKYYVSKH